MFNRGWGYWHAKIPKIVKSDELVTSKLNYMLIRSVQIFKYSNLPKTISSKDIELTIQVNGYGGFVQKDNEWYFINGDLIGVLNQNYIPTEIIFANPYLNYFKTHKVESNEVVVMRNDDLYYGLYPLFLDYARRLVDNEKTIDLISFWSRLYALIDCPDDDAKRSVDIMLNEVSNGKIAVATSKDLIQRINANPIADKTTNLQQFVEYEQYLKASWAHEIGINANFNMKREALNSAETNLNIDYLKPLLSNMLKCRQDALEKFNHISGLNVTVELNEQWANLFKDVEEVKDNVSINQIQEFDKQ